VTDLAPKAAYLLIEDRLDDIGRKHRAIRLLGGALLWLAWAAAATVAAAVAAHLLRQGPATMALLAVWAAWLIVSAIFWLARPIWSRPRPLEMARLIEQRIPGLHNGLTNSVLLARASDLQSSPLLGEIFEEIHLLIEQKPLDQAVRLADLKPLLKRLLVVAAAVLVAAVGFRAQAVHGWQQMLAPLRFVPQSGAMRIMDVQPGDATLVAGQPLEIVILAAGPQRPEARLIFDGADAPATMALAPMPADTGLRYACRLEHVTQSMRYRAELGSSQTPWYRVNVVPEVKLLEMRVQVTPPRYTGLQAHSYSPGTAVPQGSILQIALGIDVPVQRAILQISDGRQMELTAGPDARHFSAELTILADTTLSVNLLQGAQIISKLPQSPLAIGCQIDQPPSIKMIWPARDMTTTPTSDLTVRAELSDDWGLTEGRVLMGVGDAPLAPVAQQNLQGASSRLAIPIHLTAEQVGDGRTVHLQVEAVDNRDLRQPLAGAGPQTARGPVIEIKFADGRRLAQQQKQNLDKLRALLRQMLQMQQELMDRTATAAAGNRAELPKIGSGQADLRKLMLDTADRFEFDAATAIVQRTLQMLAVNPAKEAADLSAAIAAEPIAKEQTRLLAVLRQRQQVILSTLSSLLGQLDSAAPAATRPEPSGTQPLAAQPDPFTKLAQALQEFAAQQRRILSQTAPLAQKPVDNFDDADRKSLGDLQMAQDKLDAFLQQSIADFSNGAPQDFSNPELVKDLYGIEVDVTMAADALKDQAADVAVPAEKSAAAAAEEELKNMQKWLSDRPDRARQSQEAPAAVVPQAMPELPKELEDMIGDLLEQQEDLFKALGDAGAKAQSPGGEESGGQASNATLSDSSARGVTGNVLPDERQLAGRSGEGRTGQSEGEFVGDSARGKGGRDTPTRLDQTPFQKGQIKDSSPEPTGGATGGGKLSGQGGVGLEGPLPPEVQQQLARLAQKQVELRNAAQRFNLQYRLPRYDNFKLLKAIAAMRRVESDLQANRYNDALSQRDVLIESLEASRMLLGGRIHVQLDTTPQPSGKTRQEIDDVMKGQLPADWSEALKQYYRKLSDQ